MMEVMQYEKYREMLSKLCKLDKCGDDLIIIKLKPTAIVKATPEEKIRNINQSKTSLMKRNDGKPFAAGLQEIGSSGVEQQSRGS